MSTLCALAALIIGLRCGCLKPSHRLFKCCFKAAFSKQKNSLLSKLPKYQSKSVKQPQGFHQLPFTYGHEPGTSRSNDLECDLFTVGITVALLASMGVGWALLRRSKKSQTSAKPGIPFPPPAKDLNENENEEDPPTVPADPQPPRYLFDEEEPPQVVQFTAYIKAKAEQTEDPALSESNFHYLIFGLGVFALLFVIIIGCLYRRSLKRNDQMKKTKTRQTKRKSTNRITGSPVIMLTGKDVVTLPGDGTIWLPQMHQDNDEDEDDEDDVGGGALLPVLKMPPTKSKKSAKRSNNKLSKGKSKKSSSKVKSKRWSSSRIISKR